MEASVWIGFDPREAAAFAVARHSLFNRIPRTWPIHGVVLADLQAKGLYTRPTRMKINGDGRFEMIDELSIREDYDGRMSTQHAIARFLIPHLARHWRTGWAVFMDGDMLVRGNLGHLITTLDKRFALYCVKHRYEPISTVKMDGQEQTNYARKNWSSFMIFNCAHPANEKLDLEMVNTLPGRDLHRMCWLEDDDIGELAPEWNFLVGEVYPKVEPKVIHFTNGVPDMAGYEGVPYADAWREMLNDWARKQ